MSSSFHSAEPFASTQWSLVLQARQRASPEADQALAALCRAYWYPLYAYLRRKVRSAERAEDLTQEFFARFLEKISSPRSIATRAGSGPICWPAAITSSPIKWTATTPRNAAAAG